MAHARNGDAAKVTGEYEEVKEKVIGKLDRMVRIEQCEEKALHIVEVAKNRGWLRLWDHSTRMTHQWPASTLDIVE